MRKICLVTGASRGIGRAIALRFAREGYDLVIGARKVESLAPVKADVEAVGAACEPVAADVSQPGHCARLIEAVQRRFGRLDVLVNNAGVAILAPLARMSDEEYQQTMGTNVDGVFYMTRAAWKSLTASRGVVVNISSVASVDPFAGFAAYGAAKAWVNLFTRAVADEGRADGVRVFAIAPGAVETNMLRQWFPGFPGEQTLAPEAVAEAVLAVCGPAFVHSSGQTIFVKR